MSFAQSDPDYYKPYAPIYTDKQVYTWTDKVHITIVSPSWNENKYAIDSIGDESDHQVKISTASNSLGPYRLTETSPNSGTFTGEVTLTGFSHDADGDATNDITSSSTQTGSGPTDGKLSAKDNDGLTVSFEFNEDETVVGSALIRWNIGEVS
ncbi:MAG: hypothetical protein HYU02_06990, partial [Thaumarchaeota archaeon]|nr:hypothetical protein [Nitrososphaerota archaeon]